MEKDGVAIVISNEGIEVTVTIDVNENWTVLAGAKIIESEGIAGGPTGEVWCSGGAGVLEIDGFGVTSSNEGIEVTVSIDVNELRSGKVANIIEPEGIAGGPTGEVWCS